MSKAFRRPMESQPLYKLKAEFFRTLGHPARIRILELLSVEDRSVGDLLPEIGIEASNLSQQLGVLRRSGVVTARKDGNSVIYSIASPDIAELLAVARMTYLCLTRVGIPVASGSSRGGVARSCTESRSTDSSLRTSPERRSSTRPGSTGLRCRSPWRTPSSPTSRSPTRVSTCRMRATICS